VRFVAICAVLFAVSLAVAVVLFDEAFPEASIDFRYDRDSSGVIAADVLTRQGIALAGAKRAAAFDWDDSAKIFLERSVEARERKRVLEGDVEIWYWRHRWFTPLEVEEAHVDVAPSGEIVGFEHTIAEDEARAALPAGEAEPRARALFHALGVGDPSLALIASATRSLPKRVDTTLTFESKAVRPGGAPYRYRVTFHGDRIGAFRQYLDVPESWLRSYAELRSRNAAAGAVDSLLLVGIVVPMLAVFIGRLRRGDVPIRFTVAMGAVGAALVVLVAANGWPSALAGYDTDVSWNAFLSQQAIFSILQGAIAGVFIMVVVGAGEPLFRARVPDALALPRTFSLPALRSKRLFQGLVLGYTLVPLFIAYQSAFYVTAARFGAWSPAEIPYDDILNSAVPWAAVLFMGFFPAVSEEFIFRAFSIPFFERLFRSGWIAVIVAGFIWGFGHAGYPNQPFWIRGVEVGVAGVVIGFLMLRFGLIPLLVWHYTVDAVYTALLLFRSGNAYYVVSAAIVSLVFLIPLLVSVVLLIRHRGFAPDDHLTNAAAGSAPEPPRESVAPIPLPAPIAPSRAKVLLAAVLAVAAAAAWSVAPPLSIDAARYRIGRDEALAIARDHLRAAGVPARQERRVVYASAGFRTWNESAGEDGGTPAGYARVAAERILETTGVDRLLRIQKEQVEAATWVVRLFDELRKEEIFVEVDPRRGEVVGWHELLAESAPGARQEREAALATARTALAEEGLDPAAFELKEAMPFEQPKRRDWLFHFDERARLAPDVARRASVRVSGDRATQFAKTVRVAERVVREEERETVWQTLLVTLMIAGTLLLLALVAHGFVSGVRDHGVRWRLAARGTLLLAPLAALATAARLPLAARTYDTALAWNTFLVGAAAQTGALVLAQLGLAFIALLVIETTFPAAPAFLSREGRRGFARDALVAGLALAGAAALIALAEPLALRWWPRAVPVASLYVPSWMDLAFAALPILWRALVGGLVVAAAGGAAAASIRSAGAPRVLLAAGAGVALVALDPGADGIEIVASVLGAVAAGAGLLLAARFILGRNPLAWFAAPFLAALALATVPLLEGLPVHRINAVALIAVAAIVVAMLIRTPPLPQGDA
jgi:membrane protease YdiL (CAAX protease family)